MFEELTMTSGLTMTVIVPVLLLAVTVTIINCLSWGQSWWRYIYEVISRGLADGDGDKLSAGILLTKWSLVTVMTMTVWSWLFLDDDDWKSQWRWGEVALETRLGYRLWYRSSESCCTICWLYMGFYLHIKGHNHCWPSSLLRVVDDDSLQSWWQVGMATGRWLLSLWQWGRLHFSDETGHRLWTVTLSI